MKLFIEPNLQFQLDNIHFGSASAYYLTKSDANQIKQMLLNYNQTRKGDTIIFS